MSDLRAAAALGVALVAAPVLRAQSIADLRGRIARLEAAQQVAIAAQHRLDSARSLSRAEGLDTARHAALTLLALPRDVMMAREAVADAWPAIERTYGSHTSDLGRMNFHLIMARGAQAPTGVPRGPVVPVIVAGDAGAHDVARRLALSAGQVMSNGLDTALHRWTQTIFPLDAQFDEIRRRDVYQELVTAPWVAIRRCFIGDVGRCRQALGLTGGADPATDWYAPEDRTRLAFERSSTGGQSTGEVALRKSCVEEHRDADCLVLLHGLPRGLIDPPLTPIARSTLVATALDLGGAGAYDRLLAHPRAPLADRLGDAAGVPADSLVAVWRNRVTALAPMSAKVPARSAWAAFGWAVVFGVLALRSSRWR